MFFVLGMCVGSFVNMLIYRTAVKYKLTKNKVANQNRSFCDFCGRQLKWYENIPIISWIIQKGNTRCCHKKLPVAYPLVEIGLGVIFLIIGLRVELVIATLLVFSAIFDLKYMILPDFSTYMLIMLAAVFYHNWLAGLGSGLFLLILYLITKGRGMGFGDVKLAVFMGLYLGYPKIIVAYYPAFIIGAVVGLGLIILKIKKRSEPIPFGPFLILGTVLASVYGDKILYYLSRWL